MGADAATEVITPSVKVATKKVKLRGTVGRRRNEPLLAKLARKKTLQAVLAVVAAGGAVGAAIGAANAGSEGKDDGVKVTVINKPATDDFEVKESATRLGNRLGLDHESVVEFVARLGAKPTLFEEHIAIPRKYESLIRQKAQKYGVDEDAALGIIAIENGGGEDAVNPITGARGVAQFLESTARQYGVDRSDPESSIDGMARYLRDNKKLFGDNMGLAVWSYHAGAGVVMKALQIYFADTRGVDIGNYGQAISDGDAAKREQIERNVKQLVAGDKFKLADLLANAAVQTKVLHQLEDNSGDYPRGVAAAAEILNGMKVSVRQPVNLPSQAR